MVKRKATKSLDEWLKEGESASAAKRPDTEIATELGNTFPLPTADSVPPQMAKETSAVVPAEMEVANDEAASWFWNLLEQSGYELW